MAHRIPVKLLSFGYKNRDPSKLGVLRLFDLRSIRPNPHHDVLLHQLDGRDPRIQQFVLGGGELQPILLEAEQHVLRQTAGGCTIAFGCLGGRHRSVVAVEVLALHLKSQGIPVVVNHLELENESDSLSPTSALPSFSFSSPLFSAGPLPPSFSPLPAVRAFSSSSSSSSSSLTESSTSPTAFSLSASASGRYEAKTYTLHESSKNQTKSKSVTKEGDLKTEQKGNDQHSKAGGKGGKARFQGRPPIGFFNIERQFEIYGSKMKLFLCRGDITVCPVEAIVNAANLACLGGKGVDGAIHTAAGPGLRALCERLPEVRTGVRCPWGEAKITGAAGLSAPIQFVIHAVGPIHPASEVYGDKRLKWQIDYKASQVGTLLRSAYDNSFARCAEAGIRSVGFPAISCGVFGFPYEAATRIALESVLTHANLAVLGRVLLVALEQPAWDAYTTVFNSFIEQGVIREVPAEEISVPQPALKLFATNSASEASSAGGQEQGQAIIHPPSGSMAGLSQSARRRLRKQKQEGAR